MVIGDINIVSTQKRTGKDRAKYLCADIRKVFVVYYNCFIHGLICYYLILNEWDLVEC